MRIRDLSRFAVPEPVLALWESRQGAMLLPVQALAVKRHGVFGQNDGATRNLLIQAPTSSGKTFVGEMAAVETALRGRQAVYLAPLKALAEEKYLEFKEKYAAFGLKVILSTRDHRDFDGDLERGEFSVAVMVYEKLSQLLVRRPERLAQIDLVIADELEILSDPERGAMAELLLTRVLRSGCRIIGLSAVIGGAEQLAGWLNADLVRHDQRPVELRHGVLHEGTFRYRTHNGMEEGEEPLWAGSEDSWWETVAANVAGLAGRGETALVFVKSKHEARRYAAMLADRLDTGGAIAALSALRAMEATRCRDQLLETLARGVAFHSTDLAPEERRIVEEAFRTGEAKVMVSTSTLAVGLNLPAQNVFLCPEKWRYDSRLDLPWKAPILHTEYENMGGRAGRFGTGHEFGRAILVAATPFDRESYWRRYVEGDREKITPQLARGPLENPVLRLVAGQVCVTADETVDFLENTLSGRWIWAEEIPLDEVRARIRGAIHRCIDWDMLAETPEGRLQATPLGQAIASRGITLETARLLEQWLHHSQTRAWESLELLLTAALSADGRMPQVLLTAREYDHADYARRLKRALSTAIPPDLPAAKLRAQAGLPHFEEMRAMKIALLLQSWIGGAPLPQIEENFNTMAGQVLSAANQVSWIIDAAAAMAAALGLRTGFMEELQALSERVQRGLRPEILPLARALRPLELKRQTLIALDDQGLHAPETLAACGTATLEQWMTAEQARAVLDWAQTAAIQKETTMKNAVQAPPRPTPVLVIDGRRPGEFMLDGIAVQVQDKQYRLLCLLAARPGECVSYDEIYAGLWGDAVIVEDNQMHFQKRKLLKAIAAACPRRANLVAAVPKHGFRLNLAPQEVLLHPAGARTAA
jgi:helicase